MEVTEYNNKITSWVGRTSTQLKRSIASLSTKGKGELMRSLFGKTKKDFGEIESIVYSFNRYGVFFHKGVGRGYKMVEGKVLKQHQVASKVVKKRGLGKNPSFASGGSWYALIQNNIHPPRQPKEWFNPVLDREVPKLADLVGQMKADMAAQATVKVIK